jgi:broad specificity polyphosphatase/5'/3'-nucleotidase SurE
MAFRLPDSGINRRYGKNRRRFVVAPDKPQSGMGHAITTNNTLYLNKISKENDD